MKNKILSVFLIVAMLLSIVLISTAIAMPTSNVTLNSKDGTTSYLETTLTGIPPDQGISDGTYPGWCVDVRFTLPRGQDHTVTLYSSLDTASLVTPVSGEAWNMVNYILNNKQGEMGDIQAAIWYFVNFYPTIPSTQAYFEHDMTPELYWYPPSLETQSMVQAAIDNGAGFVPGPGEIFAVICLPTTDVQISIVELEIPERSPGLSPGFWKHNVGVYLELAQGSYSDPVNSPIVDKESMETFLGQWTDAELKDLYDALNTKGGGATGAETRVNAANVFNAAAGLSDYID